MKKIRVGDIVTCIESNTDRLKIGNTYRVTKVYTRLGQKQLKLAETSGSWYEWRFRLKSRHRFMPQTFGFDETPEDHFGGVRVSKPQPECKRLLRCIGEE